MAKILYFNYVDFAIELRVVARPLFTRYYIIVAPLKYTGGEIYGDIIGKRWGEVDINSEIVGKKHDKNYWFMSK